VKIRAILPGTDLIGPIIFALALAAVLAIFVSYPWINNSTPAQLTFEKNPAMERLDDKTRTCYRILAFGRAQPGLLEKLSSSSFDDMVFLGGFYRDWCKWDKAREYYTLALNLAEKTKNREQRLSALNNLGLAYYLEGDTQAGKKRSELFEQSQAMYTRALSLTREAPEHPVTQTIKANYRYLLLTEGRYQEADALLSASEPPSGPAAKIRSWTR
jgi:tetratricopeptide (TPR) repeat protein